MNPIDSCDPLSHWQQDGSSEYHFKILWPTGNQKFFLKLYQVSANSACILSLTVIDWCDQFLPNISGEKNCLPRQISSRDLQDFWTQNVWRPYVMFTRVSTMTQQQHLWPFPLSIAGLYITSYVYLSVPVLTCNQQHSPTGGYGARWGS